MQKYSRFCRIDSNIERIIGNLKKNVENIKKDLQKKQNQVDSAYGNEETLMFRKI